MATFSEKFRYKFDNFMAKGPGALILVLAGLLLLIILLTAFLLMGIGQYEGIESIWQAFTRSIDAGTMGGDEGWGFRFISTLVTIAGIFISGALIAVLATGLDAKLEELRKGRSKVIENGHQVILGFAPQVYPIISELILANENQKKPVIVVMGDVDKVEMEESIRTHIDDLKNTKIVCRAGSPVDLADLDIVNLHTAKSIIIVSPPHDHADAEVIKTILAITNNPQRKKGKYHIVAEIRDAKNVEAAQMVGKDEVEIVLVGNLIAKIIAQTCRQSGLSVVYSELLDFSGGEIYFTPAGSLSGKTFENAVLQFEKSALLGIFRAGEVLLNPKELVLNASDQLIAVSQDDDTITPHGNSNLPFEPSVFRTPTSSDAKKEKTLILGWNWRTAAIINELDHYVPEGSQLTLVVNQPEMAEAAQHLRLKNQNLVVKIGDTTQRSVVESLNVTTFDHVIVLPYADHLDVQQADAITLVTLLHLREIADKAGSDLAIVSEMMDLKNRELAEVTRADDFIVSDRLISLMMAQVSENKHLNTVFTDLFSESGNEIYLKPASEYVALNTPVNFYSVVASARQQGHLAFGYRLEAESRNATAGYGVYVNPLKSTTLSFGAEDKIIVLAEN